ncbi:MAG: SDR family oxidoreductase [Gammaproteobacteria bacterium]|nr:SDR family oxidoreductase [Gammaproteobacteria bacterium]
MTQVLIIGGSGALGTALLKEIRKAGVAVAFTYCQNTERATALSREYDSPSYGVDLRNVDAVDGLFDTLAQAGQLPNVVIHCAGVAPATLLDDITATMWDELHAIHGRTALLCAQQMARRNLRGALILVAALDGVYPVPAPAHYAASQAALWGLTQALAKELGPRGILVNLAVVGVLDGGIAHALVPKLREAYRRHAALARTGTCEEAARGLRWLALENTYLNGAQFPLTGGLG